MAASSAVVVGADSRAYSTVPPAWKDEAGTIGVFSGWSGPGAGRPALTMTVSIDSRRGGCSESSAGGGGVGGTARP